MHILYQPFPSGQSPSISWGKHLLPKDYMRAAPYGRAYTQRWKYSACLALFLLVRQPPQDFFVLLNSSTTSMAVIYPPTVPGHSTAFLYIFSTTESNIFSTPSTTSRASASRTAASLGIFPRMKLPKRLPMLSGALKKYGNFRIVKAGP